MQKVNPYTTVKRVPKQTFHRDFKAPPPSPYGCSIHGGFDAMRTGDALPECPQCLTEVKGEVTENPPLYVVGMDFKKMGTLELSAANDYAEMMKERYVTGRGVPGRNGWVEPEALPPVDDQPVMISESTCRVAAMLFIGQTGPDSGRYTFEEIVSHMVNDSIAEQMVEVVPELPVGSGGDAPLASTGSTPA